MTTRARYVALCRSYAQGPSGAPVQRQGGQRRKHLTHIGGNLWACRTFVAQKYANRLETPGDTLIRSVYALLDEGEAGPRGGDLSSFVEEQAERMGLSQRQLSEALGVARPSLQRHAKGEAQKLDVLTFLKLVHFFGLDPQTLLDKYVAGLEPGTSRDLQRVRKLGYLVRTFDLERLKRAGVIPSVKDFDAIERRLTRFFGLTSILEYESLVSGALFSSTKRATVNPMLRFWVSAAVAQIRATPNRNPYDRALLMRIVPTLRALTRDVENGFLTAARALYSAGVTVIVQTYLRGTQVRGATFVADGRPYVVLSAFNDRYDTLWFSLVHELYHVLKDLDRIQQVGYHVTGEPELFVDELTERLADEFAAELLVPRTHREYVRGFVHVPRMVDELAARWSIHRGILYGAHLWDNEEDYPRFRTSIPKAHEALKGIQAHPWDRESIAETADQLRAFYHLVS